MPLIDIHLIEGVFDKTQKQQMISKVTDASKKQLEAERLTNNSTVRFNLATPIPKGTSTSFTFEYAGTLKGSETSPVEGIKLASV